MPPWQPVSYNMHHLISVWTVSLVLELKYCQESGSGNKCAQYVSYRNVHSTCLTEMCTLCVLPKCAQYVPYRNVHSTCRTKCAQYVSYRNVHSTCLTETFPSHNAIYSFNDALWTHGSFGRSSSKKSLLRPKLSQFKFVVKLRNSVREILKI